MCIDNLLIKKIALFFILFPSIILSSTPDSFDADPPIPNSNHWHKRAITMPDAAFNNVCVGTRALSMIMVNNFFARKSVGEQLCAPSPQKMSYNPTLLNHLKNAYGGGGIRSLSFLAHNMIATQFLKHGQNIDPWLFTGITGLYGALSTPFEALCTQKIHSICEWSTGKQSAPLSYLDLMKKNGRYLFRGASLNAIIYGGSWPLFMHYVKYIKDDFNGTDPIHVENTLMYSALWAGIETATLTPFFVIQRRMQQKPNLYPTLSKTCIELFKEGGLKTFYLGSGAAFSSIFVSTCIDFIILQYMWKRQTSIAS